MHDWEPGKHKGLILKLGLPILNWAGRLHHFKLGSPHFKTEATVKWGLTCVCACKSIRLPASSLMPLLILQPKVVEPNTIAVA